MNFKATKVSRRLTGDFSNMVQPLKALVAAESPEAAAAAAAAAEAGASEPSGAQTRFRVAGVRVGSKFPFKKSQLTIALEAEKVRSSETSESGVEDLIDQEIVFQTDPYLERVPQFRLKEKDMTMSPDFGRSAKLGEGSLTLNTTVKDIEFPKRYEVEFSVRGKVVGALEFEVTYENFDLDKIIADHDAGKVHGYKNFTIDGDSVAVQEAAIEWANCLKAAIRVVNYSLTATDIGFCCTVWYAIADHLEASRIKREEEKKRIAKTQAIPSRNKTKSPSKSPTKSPRAHTKKSKSKRAGKKDEEASE